jgi:hypothetical protein
VDLQATATSDRTKATIVAVDALAPLRSGDNAVRVSFFAYGVAATQTVDTTVTIPDDGSLTGTIEAWCFNSSEDSAGDDSSDGPSGHPTVAGVVDELNRVPAYNTLYVGFVTDSDDEMPATQSGESGVPSSETSCATSWYLTGSADAEVSGISADAGRITYGEDAFVTGEITGPTVPVEVSVYGLESGGEGDTDETLLATGLAEWEDDTLVFSIPVSGLTGATELRIAIDGGDGYTPAETYVSVAVRGRVRITATPKSTLRRSWVRFTASVTPRTAIGTVKFQYYDKRHKKWRTISTKQLTRASTSARATGWWRPPRGTWKVRAVYSGDWGLDAAASPYVTIKVR